MPSNGSSVPSNGAVAPSHSVSAAAGEGTGRQRSERLRARRDAAGLAQVSGWVPKERRAHAREVLAALACGANSLPPDPAQAQELQAARAAAEAARAGEAAARADLAQAEERACAAGRRAELAEDGQAAALARAEAAERGREEATRELAGAKAEADAAQEREKVTQEAADALRGELAGIRSRKGWRGMLLRLAGAQK